MPNQDIVDISDFASARRQHKRRRRLRIFISVMCVVIMVGIILGIAALSYTNTRRDVLALTDNLLQSLKRRIVAQVESYLVPISDMAQVAAGFVRDEGLNAEIHSLLESFGMQILNTYSQNVAFAVGDPLGNFLMTKKMPNGSIDTKIMERNENGPQTTWFRRDPSGNTIKFEQTQEDSFDPRTRPWYQGALRSPGVFWTDAYIFFTDQKPGITAALAVRNSEKQLQGVISLDILLEELSAFLGRLKIGVAGTATIIDAKGYLIAHPDMDFMINQQGKKLQHLTVAEFGDPVLTRSYDRFRIEKHGTRYVTVDGLRYISLASSIPLGGGQNWTLLIIAPEEDFVGFVRHNVRNSLLMALGVVGLAILMACLLVWQGVRADRNIQRLRTHRRQFVSQSQAFSDLANRLALYDPADMVVAGRVTEIIVNAIQVRRASIWRLVEGKGCLFCEDAYDRESDGHTQGNVLLRHDFESFFEALEKEDTLMLSDAGQHPQTAELYRLYLHPLDCSALLMAPIRLHGAVVGALFFEGQSGSRTWSSHEVTFAKAIAGLLALWLQARGELLADQCEITPPPISQDATSSEIDLAGEASRQRFWGAAGRANLFYERLQAQGLDHRQLGAEVFSNIAVLALKLTNPFTLAETLDEAGGVNVLAHLVHHMEALATLHEIDYLKIMGSRIIAAAGFGADPGKKLLAVADMALTIQDRCRHVFADMDIPMEFRIGFDMGPVIGSIVGEQKNYYNLWGDAVIAATLMAEAGVAGGIHTTETVYRHLRSQYVFKKRGAYYLEETGEMQTYLLTSRL